MLLKSFLLKESIKSLYCNYLVTNTVLLGNQYRIYTAHYNCPYHWKISVWFQISHTYIYCSNLGRCNLNMTFSLEVLQLGNLTELYVPYEPFHLWSIFSWFASFLIFKILFCFGNVFYFIIILKLKKFFNFWNYFNLWEISHC